MNIVWFRRDLRVEDNPALYHASQTKQPVIALYIATPDTWQSHHMGAPQIDWLHQNLAYLKEALSSLGIPLLYKKATTFSASTSLLLSMCKELKASGVYFNKEYEWDERQRDSQLIDSLASNDITTHTFDEQCLIAPDIVKNQQGRPYGVFTPFKKACQAHLRADSRLLRTLPGPNKQPLAKLPIASDAFLASNATITPLIQPGHEQAFKRLASFVADNVTEYNDTRDFPRIDGTSLLSPYLALGVLSVRQCIAFLQEQFNHNFDDVLLDKGAATWLSELLWRDFYKMICFNFPQVSRGIPYKKSTLKLQWDNNPEHLAAWKEGRTGVPIIDAAMRQLNTCGWMHNRLRMVVAMYLTKNLWQDWRIGEAYFAEKLIDWDFASNNGGWQWCASTGTDAAPYFRVFNPVTQSERFDADGSFIRRFCPELAALDDKSIHDPYSKKQLALNYPRPLVDLKSSRKYAIEQFSALKNH